MDINEKTKFKDLLKTQELKSFKNDLMVECSGYWKYYLNKLTFEDLAKMQKTWNIKDIMAGLKYLDSKQRYNVYSVKERQFKNKASLIYLPAKEKRDVLFYC